MKKLHLLIIMFSFFSLSAINIFAGDFSRSKKELIVKNLVKGIKSDNPGIRVGSAEIIFKLIEQDYFTKVDFTPAVIPLMKMLRNGNSDLERLTAALAIYKIEDARGIYHLRNTARFDKSEKVRKTGKNLYYNYHLTNGSTYFLDF